MFKFLSANLLTLLVLFSRQASAQELLDAYIHRGLDSNLLLQQHNIDLERAQLDLRRAQTLFFPRADLASDYSLAYGGRKQDLPVGDLLNGVYKSLNQLTGSQNFPQVHNQTIQFLPNNFQDTRITVSMPVVNMDIRYNKQIKKEGITSAQADLDIYKRELVKTIKQAYYQWLQASKAVKILENALDQVKENLRVSRSFVKNEMATRESVLRAEAQVSQVQTSFIAALNEKQNTAAYFNFLLNQPLDTELQVDSTVTSGLEATTNALPSNYSGREELVKIRSARQSLQSVLKLDQLYYVPHLNLFYNIGFQGFGYKFDGKQFYQLGGFQLQWSLFRANDNRYKIRQAQGDLETVNLQVKQLQQQLQLQIILARNGYEAAKEALKTSYAEQISARETYRFAEKRFREGQALQIELIDARSQMTNAEIRYSLAQLAALSKAAELERVTASYPL